MARVLNRDQVVKLKDGRSLGYAVFGDKKGKPLIYFHGWPSSRLHAQVMDDAAKKLKIKIISVDRPGIGLSDNKPNRTLLDFPDDIVELADRLKLKKFPIIGVSGGGPYAAVCAYKIAQRITKTGIVVGLAPFEKGLLKGVGWMNNLAWSNYKRLPFLMNVSSFLGWLELKLLNTHFAYLFVAKSDKAILTSAFKNNTKRSRTEAFRQGIKGVLKDLKLYTNNWGFKIKDIKSKVVLFYGQADKNVSVEMGKYYASQILKSTLVVYPNEGHFIQITHAEEILKTLTS